MDAKSTSALQQARRSFSAPALAWRGTIGIIIFACGSMLSGVLQSQLSARQANPSATTYQLEKQMLDLINRDRMDPFYAAETRGRARPLVWDERLASVARAHSEEMARARFFSHEGADGASPGQRISAAGIQWTRVGENIAACQSISQAESTFMDEPKFVRNHRWNILNPDYTRVGIGIVKGADGTLYITEDFAQVR